MLITQEWLKGHKACQTGIDWVVDTGEWDVKKLVKLAIKSDQKEILKYANWGIVRCLNKEKCIKYAIYSAKLVVGFYEKYKTGDQRPRRAINAAQNYLKLGNKAAADAADAADAAYAAADAAYADAAYAAADAAYAAAADAAYAAGAGNIILIKILKYGLKLIPYDSTRTKRGNKETDGSPT